MLFGCLPAFVEGCGHLTKDTSLTNILLSTEGVQVFTNQFELLLGNGILCGGTSYQEVVAAHKGKWHSYTTCSINLNGILVMERLTDGIFGGCNIA